jgi:hypothetical protein
MNMGGIRRESSRKPEQGYVQPRCEARKSLVDGSCACREEGAEKIWDLVFEKWGE